ncbi:MAG: methionine biosynthesis protein MetW [Verrucomicrobiota bacterium]
MISERDDNLSLKSARIRNDYRLILDLIEPGSQVLDLGCGNGHLLYLLREEKQVNGYGVELAESRIIECVERGLSVFQGNLDEGLRDFDDQSFDYVLLNQTLPVVHKPPYLVEEMVRVGKRGIITFPNFGYWRIRWKFILSGNMPITESMPYEWYDTPNIHNLTLKDFRFFCRRFGITILSSTYFSSLNNGKSRIHSFLPNCTAAYGLFVVTKGN